MPTRKQIKQLRNKHATKLRNNLTKYEELAVIELNDLSVEYKVQYCIGFYIVDFFIPSKMLVIEIDGKVHDEQKEHDQKRDNWLESIGFNVVRVKNNNTEDIPKIVNACVNKSNKELQKAMGKAGQSFRKGLLKGYMPKYIK